MAASLLCPIFITLIPRLIMMLPTWQGRQQRVLAHVWGKLWCTKQLQKATVAAYQVDADPDHPSFFHDNSKTSCDAAAAADLARQQATAGTMLLLVGEWWWLQTHKC